MAASKAIVKEVVDFFFTRPEWALVVTLFGALNEPSISRLNKNRVRTWYQESYTCEGCLWVKGRKEPALREDCSCYDCKNWQAFDDDYKGLLLSFASQQTDAFQSSTFGWFFWTYKTENHVNPHWDYVLGYEQN